MSAESGASLNGPLRKELGLVDVITITTGSMISSGLFVIPGIAFTRAGPAVILSYLLAALIALPTMLSAAELATAMPKAGGIYYFVSRSMGFGVGTAAGFARWLSISLKSAFSLIGLGVYSVVFLSYADPLYISLAFCLLFITINLIGIKLVGKTQTLLTCALISLLFIISFFGLGQISIERFAPFAPHTLGPVFSTAGFIFISYGGMLSISGLAEEVKSPKKNIPLGMLISLALTGIVYTLVIFVVIGVLEPSALKNTLTPVSDGASIYLGRTGLVFAITAALLAFVTTANAGIASASRYPLAMSRDGLLPQFFSNSSRQAGIPYLAVLLTGGFILITITVLQLNVLVEAASSLLMLTYIMTNLSVILLRRQNREDYCPTFHSPLFPYLQIFSIAGLLALIASTGTVAILISLTLIALSLIWHPFYKRRANLQRENKQ